MKKWTFIFFASLTTVAAFADDPHVDRLDVASLGNQGKIVSFKFEPGQSHVQAFIAGKKSADISFKRIKVLSQPRRELDPSIHDLHLLIPTEGFKYLRTKELTVEANITGGPKAYSIELR